MNPNNIQVGSVVRYDGGSRPEYGIVVQTYYDQGDLDCYVAFWGHEIPTQEETFGPEHQPYILRYYAASLEHVEGLERDLSTGIWKWRQPSDD